MSKPIELIPIAIDSAVQPGDDVAELILRSLPAADAKLLRHDVIVVCSKVIAKSENRVVCLDDVEPSALARQIAQDHEKDPRLVEVVLRESKRIVRMGHGVLITESRHGHVCANAGVDRSNVDGGNTVSLLPVDPDGSARRLRHDLEQRSGVRIAVVISDTFGRPWRLGQIDVAIGAAGLEPIMDFRGQRDRCGMTLDDTLIAIADVLAASAGLTFRKDSDVVACIVRNCDYVPAEYSGASQLVRDASIDLFR